MLVVALVYSRKGYIVAKRARKVDKHTKGVRGSWVSSEENRNRWMPAVDRGIPEEYVRRKGE